MRLLTIAIKSVAAGVLVALGTVLLVLPGPGLPLIVGGLAMFATEFEWAATLHARVLSLLQSVLRSAAGAMSKLRGKAQHAPCTSGGCS